MPAFSCCEFTHASAAPLAVHDTAGKSECASSRDRDRGGADRHNTQGSMAVARHCRSDLVGLVDGQTVKNIKKSPAEGRDFSFRRVTLFPRLKVSSLFQDAN